MALADEATEHGDAEAAEAAEVAVVVAAAPVRLPLWKRRCRLVPEPGTVLG